MSRRRVNTRLQESNSCHYGNMAVCIIYILVGCVVITFLINAMELVRSQPDSFTSRFSIVETSPDIVAVFFTVDRNCDIAVYRQNQTVRQCLLTQCSRHQFEFANDDDDDDVTKRLIINFKKTLKSFTILNKHTVKHDTV